MPGFRSFGAWRRWLSGLALAWWLVPLAGHAELPTLKVAGENAPPYRMFGEGVPSGWYFDLARELGRRAGFNPVFVEVPPARALAMMRTGEVDMMIGPTRKPEREEFMFFLEPSLPPAGKAFYMPPGSSPLTRYEDLQGRLIGIERGKMYFQPFDNDPAVNKDVSDDYATAFRKLAMKRLDAVLAPESEGDYLLHRLGLRFDKSPYRIEGQPCYVTLSRQSTLRNLMPAIEAALWKLQQQGMFERLRDRYQ